ncbi:MAG TPA: NPCBM/NEW2 domain-containing protein, partial [Fibrobacteraceae bacterium]|nr:NPCBM/NEW2 domain-containing protein [Fibrobacteraceae bacterium]
VLIALPSFAWIMALGLWDFLSSAPKSGSILRRYSTAITVTFALGLSLLLTYQHINSFRNNMLYFHNKLLAEEDYLNTELKKLPTNSIFLYSRPWQMICSGFNAFSENTLLGWTDQEFAKWRSFSDDNIYLVRGQDGFGNVDRNSRVVGFKTTEPIQKILTGYATEKEWSNSKDFGYPLTLTHIGNHKGHSPYAEGLVTEMSATVLQPGAPLRITLSRSFSEALPCQWALDHDPVHSITLDSEKTAINIDAKTLKSGMHHFHLQMFAPDSDTVQVSLDFFLQTQENALLQTLDLIRQSQAWSTPHLGKSVENNTLKIAQRAYGFGIGAHANSSLTFRINGRFHQFHSIVGLDDESACGDGATWLVRGDQKVLWKSENLTSQMVDSISVDISGIQVLELETQQGENNMCDHTDWANAWIE